MARNCYFSVLHRKHYFYPDLPKGYQISQYKKPLCEGGELFLNNGNVAELERIHLEEDTAKSMHEGTKTLIDFNKSGMPLVEIVTKPTFKSIEDAVEFCKKVQDLVRFLKIGNVDMEKGQMRLEANISMRTAAMEAAGELPNYKVEVKNINSFRFMEKAVKAEMKRQSELLAAGETVKQENRGWNEAKGTTVSQRDKEEAHDYRYFPEPDIPPMYFDAGYLADLRGRLPKLPLAIRADLEKGISKHNAIAFTEGPGLELLPKLSELLDAGLDANKVANLLLNKPEYRELSVEEFKAKLSEDSDKISDTGALETVVTGVISANPKALEDFKKGKASSVEFLLGMVMRETKGKADAGVVRSLLLQKLSS